MQITVDCHFQPFVTIFDLDFAKFMQISYSWSISNYLIWDCGFLKIWVRVMFFKNGNLMFFAAMLTEIIISYSFREGTLILFLNKLISSRNIYIYIYKIFTFFFLNIQIYFLWQIYQFLFPWFLLLFNIFRLYCLWKHNSSINKTFLFRLN